MVEEQNTQECTECGTTIEGDIECPECGNIVLELEDEEPEDDVVKSEGSTAGLGSLGEMIEMKVLNTVKEREEQLRESMNRSVQEKERRLRDKAEEAIENLREKHGQERTKLMEQLEDLRKEKEELRAELEGEKKELNAKLEERQEALDELKEKHHRQVEAMRANLERKREKEKEVLLKEKEGLRDRFEKEKGELQEKFEQDKKEMEERMEELRDKMAEIREEEQQKREELLKKHEEEKEALRKELGEENEKVQEELESLRRTFMEEQKRYEERMSQEREHLEERLDKEKSELKERYKDEIEDLKEILEREREIRISMGKGEVKDDRFTRELEEKLRGTVYPFPAIVGQERMKRSLLLNAINHEINGVLLWGPNGSAKRTAVLGIAELLSDIEGLDMDTTKIWDDPERYISGTLVTPKANASYLIDTLLHNGALSTKSLNGEAVGKTILVKEVSASDKEMLSHIDSFTLHVKIDPPRDLDRRMEVVRRYKEFCDDPEAFHDRYSEEIDSLRNRIIQTREILPSVNVHSRQRSTISKICAHNDLPSGIDIAIEEISRTITAYDGREEVLDEDIQEALDLALVHRVTGDLTEGR